MRYVRKHGADRAGELRPVTGARRRDDDAWIIGKSVDDEFVAIVRTQVRSQRVGIETDIAVNDRAGGAGQQLGERRSDRSQFVVGRRRAPGVGADN